MLLAGMITLVMLLVARPVRRMWQMTELAVGAVGGALPAAPPGVLARLRRRRPGVDASASERFWEEARAAESEPGAATTNSATGGVMRPEAGAPVVLAAPRWDPRGSASIPSLRPGGSPNQGDGAAALAGPGTGTLRPDRLAALPAGFSVTGRARTAEEQVYVPSALSDPRAAPRQAELEEVAGRPVWVVYRPSAGLEMGAPGAPGAENTKRTDNAPSD
jgi:hypothetical protein